MVTLAPCKFDNIKAVILSKPRLKLQDFTKPFEVVTDASKLALGKVLNQEEQPVAYTSWKLRTYDLRQLMISDNYTTHDLDLLAIMYALKLWMHYPLSHFNW